MIRARKLILLFLSIVLCFFAIYVPTFASTTETVPIIEEVVLPHNLNFTVNDRCSGHTYFMQAAANATGQFLVYSRHINPDDYSDVDFKKVFIDIYSFDGVFLQELSLTTSSDLAVAFEGNTVMIYFYSSVLSYDLTTQECHYYITPEGMAINQGLYKQLRSEKFTAGRWSYRCKKSFGDFVELVRSDGDNEQVLVEMPGRTSFFSNVVIPGFLVGINITVITIWLIRRKKSST